MINYKVKEYSNDGLAIRVAKVTLFGIPLYKFKKTSTNRIAVAQLTTAKNSIKIKGFSNETEDKSKKNQ